MECDLTFVGLLVMQNKLKPETTPIITTLQEADIRTVMVTGESTSCYHDNRSLSGHELLVSWSCRMDMKEEHSH